MSTTPYMNLEIPVPSTTPGPEWAEEVVTAFDTVDAHDHTAGKGTPVPVSGLNINNDLNFQNHRAQDVGAVLLQSNNASIPATNVQAVYSITGDLWYNNSAGVPVQLTQGNSIVAASSAAVPAGVIWPYGGSSAPAGFLMCDGSAISRGAFATLFAAIGTTYGVGDGATTFNLPTTRGRVPVGAGFYVDPVVGGITRTIGQYGGEASTALTATNLAAHAHGLGSHKHQIMADIAESGTSTPSNTTQVARARSSGPSQDNDFLALGVSTPATVGLSGAAGGSTDAQGDATPHNTMQPYLVTNYIIKT